MSVLWGTVVSLRNLRNEDLNGKFGRIVGVQQERVVVEIEGVGRKAFRRENLRIPSAVRALCYRCERESMSTTNEEGQLECRWCRGTFVERVDDVETHNTILSLTAARRQPPILRHTYQPYGARTQRSQRTLIERVFRTSTSLPATASRQTISPTTTRQTATTTATTTAPTPSTATNNNGPAISLLSQLAGIRPQAGSVSPAQLSGIEIRAIPTSTSSNRSNANRSSGSENRPSVSVVVSGEGEAGGSGAPPQAAVDIVENIMSEILSGINRNLPPPTFLEVWVDALGTYEQDLEALLHHLHQTQEPRGPPPASEEAIARLAVDDVTSQTSEICSICQDPFKPGDRSCEMPCKHKYHCDCLMPWLKERNSCPTCRYELPTDDEEYERNKRERQQQSQANN